MFNVANIGLALNSVLTDDVLILWVSVWSAAADRPGTGHRGSVVRPRFDSGQLRLRVTAIVRAIKLDVADPRHGARHETVPLHGRLVPGAREPVRRGRRRAGPRRFRASQPNAPSPDAPTHQRAQAGQGHSDGSCTASPGPVRPGGRGRDRIWSVGHVVRQWRQQRSTSRRRRVHGRRFYGNSIYTNDRKTHSFK